MLDERTGTDHRFDRNEIVAHAEMALPAATPAWLRALLDGRPPDRASEALWNRVEAVAVCYLHAYRDPRHEAVTAEALSRAMPDAYVSLSSQVLPQIKEFERVSTTIVNAYVGPVLSRYLARLESRLAEAGYRGSTLIIQSHGGVAPIAEAGRLAAGAVRSGPAGGAAGSV